MKRTNRKQQIYNISLLVGSILGVVLFSLFLKYIPLISKIVFVPWMS